MSRTSIPRNLQAEVFHRDGFRCRYCGSVDGPFELDHVYPEAKGGQTTAENLVVACKACNQLKRDNVGMWPFPVGHFETADDLTPNGDDRYWNYLRVARGEIEQAILKYEYVNTEYIRMAHAFIVGGKKDVIEGNRLLVGQGFVDLHKSAEVLVLRLKHIRLMLNNACSSSKIKSFLLTLTGQALPTVDLKAWLVAIGKVAEDTESLIGEASVFVPEDRPTDTNVAFAYFVPMAKTIDTLGSCLLSLDLISDLLYQAQLSIVPKEEYGHGKQK